jgi:hypothetical protein
MTESEWLAGTDPYVLLDSISVKVTDRKRWLFAVACYRGALPILRHEQFQAGIHALERRAEEIATGGECHKAGSALRHLHGEIGVSAPTADETAASYAALILYRLLVGSSGRYAARDAYTHTAELLCRVMQDERHPVKLMRDIFGNPFSPITLLANWLHWNDSCPVRIAEAIYDERAFDRLPILADALEDAGCDNADILAHCRGPGPHVRGCWVVDLLLGKT